MRDQDRQGEFHRADPGYRRQMQIALALTIVVGAVALLGLQWWLRKLGAHAGAGDLDNYETWLHRLLAGLCLVLAAAAAGFGLWLYRTARDTARERRWPPSSMRTSSDVRIRWLTSADALVAQLRGGAYALFALAIVLAAWAIWLFRS
jgi:hypothetical protein